MGLVAPRHVSSSRTRNQTHILCIGRQILNHWTTRKVPGHHLLICCCMHAKSLQSCLTLCDPMDCSPPASSVRGAVQARILGWVAISSSRGSSQPTDRTHVSCVSCAGRRILPRSHLGQQGQAPDHLSSRPGWQVSHSQLSLHIRRPPSLCEGTEMTPWGVFFPPDK